MRYCPDCYGEGTVEHATILGGSDPEYADCDTTTRDCEFCGGTGEVEDEDEEEDEED